MVIKNNIQSLGSCNVLKKNDKDNNSAIMKLSTGLRINYAADDASGLGISEKLRSQIKGLGQASANSQDGLSMVQTIEGATNEVHEILNRMVTLAATSSNGTKEDEDRNLIEKEVQQLKQEIDRIAKDTDFNGKKVLDGSFGKDGERLDLLVGENPGFVISFPPIESISCDSLKIDDLSVADQDKSEKALDKLTKAIDVLSEQRIQIGSVGKRVEYAVKSADNNSENLTATESRIRDTDMAKEAMQHVKSNILMNSTESVLVQANNDPKYVLALMNN